MKSAKVFVDLSEWRFILGDQKRYLHGNKKARSFERAFFVNDSVELKDNRFIHQIER